MKKKHDTTFVTLGASNHAKSNRELHDFYSTDALAITLLHKHDLLDKNVPYWETAVGGGRLSSELKRLGYNVIRETDLYDHGYGDTGVDFFEETEVFQGNTITNPPFNRMNDWMEHSLKVTGNKAYIFGRIQTVESIGRWNRIFKYHKPLWICPFVKRIQCYKNDDLSEKGSPLCYAWFIWDVNNVDCETRVKWLI